MPNSLAKKTPTSVLNERRTCLVIGGGLAGLAAALRAQAKHWQVHLFEAQAQLGGRVKSHYFHDPRGYGHLVCELGGEWIGSDHRRMWKLVDEFRLKTINHQYSLSFWDVNRQVQVIYRPNESPFSPRLEKAFQDFAREFRAMSESPAKLRKLDKLDWWTRLKQMGYREQDLARRDLMDGTDFGESIRHTSAYAGATEYVSTKSGKANDTDEMDFKIAGGNSLLIDAIERKIGAYAIHKGSAVESVVQPNKKGKVEIHLANGEVYEGDTCICAVPARCLRKIDWKPRKPKAQLEASDQLQYARITKTAVLFRKRFWDEALKEKRLRRTGGFSVFSDRVSDFCFDSTYLQDPPGGILCSYAIGDKADDIASEPDPMQVGRWIAKDVCDAIGKKGKVPKVLAVQQQAWQKESWISGAYAFYRPGQWFDLQPVLSERFERVFFAGEHIADAQGFMEGAVQTGQDAADDMHERYGK